MDGRAQNRTAPPDHVDLEDLAALIDERLPAGDCSRVRTHLAECEECYEIFADVVRFQEEGGAQGAGDAEVEPPSPFGKTWNTPRSWLTAAAAAALVMTVGWFGYQQMTPPSFSAAQLTGSFADSVPSSHLYQEERLRGGEEQTDEENASVGLGVQVVDLQVALASSSDDDVDDIRRVIRGLSGQLAFADQDEIDRALALLEVTKNRETAIPELEAALLQTSAEPVHFDLGRWAEASRLAAVGREAVFFADHSNRRALSWLTRQDELENGTRAALQRLREPWERRQFEQLERGLSELISRYYRQQNGPAPALFRPERLKPRPAPGTPRSVPALPDTTPLAAVEYPPWPALWSAAAETPAPPARRSSAARERAAPRTR